MKELRRHLQPEQVDFDIDSSSFENPEDANLPHIALALRYLQASQGVCPQETGVTVIDPKESGNIFDLQHRAFRKKS